VTSSMATLTVSSGTKKTYSTTFPLTENPISEGGNWVGGESAGGNLWGNVQTSGGLAFGVSEPTTYGDPSAVLTGTWQQNETATGVIKIVTTPQNCCHEVELRLRMTISPDSITGYEMLCPVWQGAGYGIQIVRWNGPNGQFVYLFGGPTHQCVNGDVLMFTATGTNPVTLSAYLNGVLIGTGLDHGTESGGSGGPAGPWTSGNPGIGFYDSADSNWSYFGLSSFSAQDNQ